MLIQYARRIGQFLGIVEDDNNALITACQDGNITLVKRLIRRGENIHIQNDLIIILASEHVVDFLLQDLLGFFQREMPYPILARIISEIRKYRKWKLSLWSN